MTRGRMGARSVQQVGSAAGVLKAKIRKDEPNATGPMENAFLRELATVGQRRSGMIRMSATPETTRRDQRALKGNKP